MIAAAISMDPSLERNYRTERLYLVECIVDHRYSTRVWFGIGQILVSRSHKTLRKFEFSFNRFMTD